MVILELSRHLNFWDKKYNEIFKIALSMEQNFKQSNKGLKESFKKLEMESRASPIKPTPSILNIKKKMKNCKKYKELINKGLKIWII